MSRSFICSMNVYRSVTLCQVLGTVDIVVSKTGKTIYKDINKGTNSFQSNIMKPTKKGDMVGLN